MANIYYHRGQADQVIMDGMSTTTGVSLVDTTYYGEVTSVSPQTSTGDSAVTISGRAVERFTGDPMGVVPLKVVITNDGFERVQTVYSEQDGTFVYDFTPLAGESGAYKVCAIHPDRAERPVQATFVISRVSLQYTGYRLTIPRNYEHTVKIKAVTGKGTSVSNLRFDYLAGVPGVPGSDQDNIPN